MTDSSYFLSGFKTARVAGRTCLAGIFKSWHRQVPCFSTQPAKRDSGYVDTYTSRAAAPHRTPNPLPPPGVTLCDSPGSTGLATRCPTRPWPEDSKREESSGFADDAWDWHLGDSETDEDTFPAKPSKAVGLELPSSTNVSPGASVVGSISPRSVSSTEASSISLSRGKDSQILGPSQPLAEMALMDGLRSLLLQQLKAQLSTDSVNLTADENELLQEHVERLHTYSQSIVQTLSVLQLKRGTLPFGLEEEVAGEPQPMIQLRSVLPQKALKLNDSEILEIYRTAQLEAGREADWRGDVSSGLRTSRHGLTNLADLECLQVVSQAMQKPGQTPEGIAAKMIAQAPSSCAWYCRSDQTPCHGISRSVGLPGSACET